MLMSERMRTPAVAQRTGEYDPVTPSEKHRVGFQQIAINKIDHERRQELCMTQVTGP